MNIKKSICLLFSICLLSACGGGGGGHAGGDGSGSSGINNPVVFPDRNLESAIRVSIGKPTGEIYASDLQNLYTLEATARGIQNLESRIDGDVHKSINTQAYLRTTRGLNF